MNNCLFCTASGPYSTVEHVIPESLGNDDLILKEEVCDKCQAYFGTELEKYVLDKTEFAFWRVFLGIKTKGKKFPSVDMSQPKKQSGRYANVHPAHDNVGFTAHEDGSTSVEINDDSIILETLDGSRNQFRLVITPHVLVMLGRFLCKVGLELICLNDSAFARDSQFDLARKYARTGQVEGNSWPLFHFDSGSLSDLRKYKEVEGEVVEEVSLYEYALGTAGPYVLFRFGMGTSNWIICLNDPYPTAEIREGLPDNIKVLWYPDSLAKKEAR